MWIGLGQSNSVTTAIAGHLIEGQHSIARERSFDIIYRALRNGSKLIGKQLSVAETTAIRLLNPTR